jgi:hypothetical protein
MATKSELCSGHGKAVSIRFIATKSELSPGMALHPGSFFLPGKAS